MKYLSSCILAMTLAFLCGSAFADTSPIAKGRKMLMGSFTLTNSGGDIYEDPDGDGMMSINGGISGGYFVIPNLSVGAKLSLARTSQGDNSSTAWGIGPQLWYFIGATEPKPDFEGSIYPFFRGSFVYSRDTTKVKISEETSESVSSMTTISFGGGACIMVSDTVGFILGADYEIESWKPEEGDSVDGNEFILSAGIIAFGY